MDKTDSSVQSAVYTALKNSIMSLQMKPGSVISTQKIADKLSVSRTPVREAFIRLQRDGLVDIFPQKETSVSLIDFSKINQERFIREMISRKNIADLEMNIEQQHATISACDFESLFKLDNAFHEYLFKVTGQELSWQTIERTSNHYGRIRAITVWNKDIMKETVLQHQKILAAIQDGSADHAKIYTKVHLHQLENQVQQLLRDYPNYFVQDTVPAEDKFEALLRAD